jgi:hypothetical protein
MHVYWYLNLLRRTERSPTEYRFVYHDALCIAEIQAENRFAAQAAVESQFAAIGVVHVTCTHHASHPLYITTVQFLYAFECNRSHFPAAVS